MFAHPLTSFWSHLEASNCHIEKKPKNRRFLTDFSNYRIFLYPPLWMAPVLTPVKLDRRPAMPAAARLDASVAACLGWFYLLIENDHVD